MVTTGYLDRVTDRALIGWIIDSELIDSLQVVVCHVGGATIRFRSTIGREDVTAVSGLKGRFGFAIPVEPLRALGSAITLTGLDGTVLNGALDVPLPLAHREPPAGLPRTWVFLHIQKTAGTSLRLAITEGRSPEETVLLYPDGMSGLLSDELADLPWSQRAALRMIAGHTYFGVHAALPHRADYLTVLRLPEARLRSHHRHHQSAGSILESGGVPMPLAEIVSHGLTEEFDNLMVRMVAGLSASDVPIGAVTAASVEQAIDTVHKHFRFIGLMEHLDQQMPALCAMLGQPYRPLDVVNRGAPRVSGDAVDWRAALHNNRFDAMLYDRLAADGLCGRDLGPRR